MILQFFCLAIFSRANQVPNKAFDVLIPTVVQKTVHKDGTAYCLHISFSHASLKASMRQNISPTSPTNKTGKATTHIFLERFKFSDIILAPRIAIIPKVENRSSLKGSVSTCCLLDTSSNLKGNSVRSQSAQASYCSASCILTHIPGDAFPPESSQCAHRCDAGHVFGNAAAHHPHFPNQKTQPGHHLSEC